VWIFIFPEGEGRDEEEAGKTWPLRHGTAAVVPAARINWEQKKWKRGSELTYSWMESHLVAGD
jgi:hypothetical protein